MAGNNNGFADALEQLNTVINVNQDVVIDVLREAAEYFVAKLRPKIPVGYGPQHMRDELKVRVKGDMVQVIFGPDAWYWHLVEHGHRAGPSRKKVKGRHFVRNTLDAEGDKIAAMMADQIIQLMEG